MYYKYINDTDITITVDIFIPGDIMLYEWIQI